MNTPDGFQANVSQLQRGRSKSRRRELLVQKGEVTPGRILRDGSGIRGQWRHAKLWVGLLNSESPGRSDTRGLSQHDRASLYHNPLQGKFLTGTKGKSQKVL